MEATIFIVDDSRTVRASIEYTLKKVGYQVESASDGSEGLETLKKLQVRGQLPAMIITDINMPNMDGLEFLKRVKGEKDFKYIPVLVLTTESESHMKEKGKKEGAAGWLVKPFKPEQLVGVVKKFVR